jgi:hypothetical protein
MFETVPPEGGRCNFVHCLNVTQTRSREEGGGETVWWRSGKNGTGINRKGGKNIRRE